MSRTALRPTHHVLVEPTRDQPLTFMIRIEATYAINS